MRRSSWLSVDFETRQVHPPSVSQVPLQVSRPARRCAGGSLAGLRAHGAVKRRVVLASVGLLVATAAAGQRQRGQQANDADDQRAVAQRAQRRGGIRGRGASCGAPGGLGNRGTDIVKRRGDPIRLLVEPAAVRAVRLHAVHEARATLTEYSADFSASSSSGAAAISRRSASSSASVSAVESRESRSRRPRSGSTTRRCASVRIDRAKVVAVVRPVPRSACFARMPNLRAWARSCASAVSTAKTLSVGGETQTGSRRCTSAIGQPVTACAVRWACSASAP